jgi:cytochrome c oxidase subunit 2
MDRRRSLIFTIAAAVLATAVGIALSFLIHWFPAQASTQAKNTDRLYHVLAIASIPIFVLVTTVVLYCAWQFHMRPGEELKDGPPIHGNTRLEVFWTAMPAALLLGLLSYSFVVLHDNEKKPAHEILVGVTAQQFAWTFQYPPSVTGGRPVQSYQLYLPDRVPVKFELHTRDVIHAFWVPALRLQEDVVPGITVSYRATPDRLGTYPIVCNLLCGVGHSLMRSRLHVITPEQFTAFLRSRGAPGTGAALTKAISGTSATSRVPTATTAGASASSGGGFASAAG